MLEMLVNVTLASSVVTRPDCPVFKQDDLGELHVEIAHLGTGNSGLMVN